MIDFERVKTDDGPLVIRATGTLDGTTNEYFFECVKDEVEAGNNKIALNFEGLGYISSVGLGALLRASAEAAKGGGEIYLSNIESNILDILKLVKFERLFNIYETEQEALLALSS